MVFLNAWALAIGGLALTVPLVIHYLTRPRPRPLPLSTIRFVMEIVAEQRSRHRLRDFLVLLMRLLAIIMIAMALARPHFPQTVIAVDSGRQQTARVLLLDTSLSMSAGRGGNQPIERARAIADRYLSYSSELSAGVITVGARAEAVFDEMSVNLPALRQSVMRAMAVGQEANVSAAIQRAGELLATAAEGAEKELVVISDFQRGNWGTARFEELPEGTRVQLESVALPTAINSAVTDVRVSDRIVVGQETSVEVELLHLGSPAVDGVCAVQIGPWTMEQPVSLRAGKQTIRFALRPDQAGWFGGVVQWRGPEDVLVEDDRRPIVIQVAAPPQILLLSEQSPALKPSSSYYLQTALESLYGAAAELDGGSDQTVAGAGVRRRRLSELTEAMVAAADVVVVDHPGRLSEQQVELLARLTRRGRGLLYFVSDLSDATNLQIFSERLAADWELPIKFLSPRGQRERKEMSVVEVTRNALPFSIFGDRLSASLASVRIGGGLPTELIDLGLRDRVSGWLEDRSAWIISGPCGGGRLTLFNGDLGQSNFAVQPAFLPILGQLIEGLLPRQSQPPRTVAGKPLVRDLDASVRLEDMLRVEPMRPWQASETGYGDWRASAGSVLWQWDRPDQVGAYQVLLADRAVAAIAVETPAIESELQSLAGDVFADRLAGTRLVGFRNAREESRERDWLWSWLLVSCLLAMVGELAILKVMRN